MHLVKLKLKQVSIALLSFSTLLLCRTTQANVTQEEIAKALGWVNQDTPCNICHGYYQVFAIPYVPNPAVKDQSENYNLYADQSEWSLKGTSTFSGHVKVIQPNAEITADRATVTRDPKTGKNNAVHAAGNVHITEPGTFAIADTGSIDLINNTMMLNNVYYRLDPTPGSRNPQEAYRIYALNANGHAINVQKVKPRVFVFKQATYSMCPPNTNAWRLTASHVRLDYNTGWGTANNALLYVAHIPIFYFPHYTFPLDKRRKTGFLIPSVTTQTNDGLTLITPFYWNMAPNYDLTITPNMMTKRGILDDNTFRYLTDSTTGTLSANIIPNDRGFKNFQSQMDTQFADQPSYSQQLNQLESDNTTRTDLSWNQSTQLNEHWTTNVIYNHDSDDYYQTDFGQNTNGAQNQLLQTVNLNYASDYWGINGLMQRYQTLHPINQANVPNQYQLWPQFNLNAHSPLLLDTTTLSTGGQYTHFTIAQNPGATNVLVSGDRAYINPTISTRFARPYGSLTPELTLHSIKYNLQNEAPGTPQAPSLLLPMFDLDGKLLMTREIHPFDQTFNQTLEPEFYYLFVPYKKQSQLPIFDTGPQAFTYDSMFQNNRFTGQDRIGDANQITLALASRFLDADDGTEKSSLKIADIYYMRNRVVDASCYGSNCNDIVAPNSANADSLSPIAVQGTYEFNPTWSLQGDWAWNPTQHITASQSLTFQYHPNQWYLLNLTYYHIDDAASGVSPIVNYPTMVSNIQPQQNLQEGIISGKIRATNNWSFLGSVDRNWSQAEIQSTSTSNTSTSPTQIYTTFLSGIQYDSCCWAMRVVAYRRYVALNQAGQPYFDNGVFYQLFLIGLGGATAGSKHGSLLADNIAGYSDDFGQTAPRGQVGQIE